MERDISNSCVSFCLPKATAPLVTMMHSRPSIWHSATCSTIEANRPRASPCSSSRVMTALPNFTTNLRQYFNWFRSLNVDRRGRSDVWSSLFKTALLRCCEKYDMITTIFQKEEKWRETDFLAENRFRLIYAMQIYANFM